MTLGPVEIIAIGFPGNQFRGEIVAALQELVENDTIRIIDLAFVRKENDGSVMALELSDLDPDDYLQFDPIVSELSGMLSDEDIQRVADDLPNGSSVGVMLFENTWATRFAEATRRANGQLLISERIPAAVIEELERETVAPSSKKELV
ncbi:MAG: DUF6325 family protein [Dehalococcoidia bacterium]